MDLLKPLNLSEESEDEQKEDQIYSEEMLENHLETLENHDWVKEYENEETIIRNDKRFIFNIACIN